MNENEKQSGNQPMYPILTINTTVFTGSSGGFGLHKLKPNFHGTSIAGVGNYELLELVIGKCAFDTNISTFPFMDRLIWLFILLTSP